MKLLSIGHTFIPLAERHLQLASRSVVSLRKLAFRILLVLLAMVIAAPQSRADALESGFRNPPHSAGIRCFWWWLNSNVTRESITRELEEMKAKGFNGAMIFDADGSNQRGNARTKAGPVFGSPQWTALLLHACNEAKRLELELSLNIQSGWNLGGPSVSPQETTQHLVWSKTQVTGPSAIRQTLPKPEAKDGFYRDVAVIAVPLAPPRGAEANGRVQYEIKASNAQPQYPAKNAMDENPDTFWASQDAPTAENPQWISVSLNRPIEISKLTLRGRPERGPRSGQIQISTDNRNFRSVATFNLKDSETLNASFPAQRASHIRLSFTSAHDPKPEAGRARNVQVAEIILPGVTDGADMVSAIAPLKDLDLKNATRALGKSAPDTRFMLETEPGKPGETFFSPAEVPNLTTKLSANGTLNWEAPAGHWEILRIGHTATGARVSTESEGWSGRVIDLLSPAALDSYWDKNITPIFKALGPHAGTTMKYVHTDSWEGGGMNWTPGFDRAFRERRGYDPTPWLAVLTGHIIGSRAESDAFLADFRKTIGDLIADHFTHLTKRSAEFGIATHPECSGPHASPLDGLKNYGRSELMMSEFWSPSPHRPDADNQFFVKQASSAAHTYGKRLVGAEGFTTIGPHWNDIPWLQMKPSFDTEICAGLNILFIHTFTSSPPEMGMPGQEYFAGTHFNPQITWWDESTAFITYLRRCQFLTQQGGFQADVLHYYGDHIPNIFGRKGHDPAGALPGYDYDVLSEELLLDKLVFADGKLRLPSGMSYQVLTLPDHGILSLGALRKIDTLARAGASILGPKPGHAVSLEGGPPGAKEFQQLADGLWGNEEEESGTRAVGKGRIAWGMNASEFLAKHNILPDLSITLANGSAAPQTDWIHYKVGEADIYFLSEFSGKPRQLEATFRVSGRIPEIWNPVDGSIREATRYNISDGRTTVPLDLGAFDSCFMVFRKPSPTNNRDEAPNSSPWQQVCGIDGPWQATFDRKLGGPAKPVAFPTLTDWLDHADPAVRDYSGKAIYTTTFELSEEEAASPIAIELGEVRGVGIARVKLNGNDLGIAWRPPFRVALGKSAKPGSNTLEVTAINSWCNRVMADAKLPMNQRITRTNIRVEKEGRFKWKPEPSGLIGPVRIVRATAAQEKQ
ncbi:MAG: glycosyl hydrolase [Verrucomicrobiales bacterium]